MNTFLLAHMGDVRFQSYEEITPEELLGYYEKGWIVFQIRKDFDIFLATKADNKKIIWLASAVAEA
jgi:hypothetical protein